jgi:hypothetical protein
MRRITVWVETTLQDLRLQGGKELERGFVVHRTMADPRYLERWWTPTTGDLAGACPVSRKLTTPAP